MSSLFALLSLPLLALAALVPSHAASQTIYPLVAGYIPYSNVTQHLRIDLDVKAFDGYSDAYDWSSALDVYLNGRNSFRTTGPRKLANFSTDARGGPNPMTGYKYYEMYASYWGSDTYAHDHVVQALQGTGDFAGAPSIVRTESATKAVQYEVMWMYALGELEDAISDCRNQNLTANDGLANSWDEGVAFYTGSLEGATGTTSGILQYALAQVRCSQFGKCNSRGVSVINTRIMGLFAQGQSLIRSYECELAYQVKEEIVRLMTVPLIQGWMRYLWRADATSGWNATTSNYAKEKAESWAFLAAFLPQVHACSASTATLLREQTHWKSTTYLSRGRNAVFKLVQDQFRCMGINCADIGNMTESGQVVLRGCPVSAGSSPAASLVASSFAIAGTALVAILGLVLVE